MTIKYITVLGIVSLTILLNTALAEIDPWTESYRLEGLYQYEAANNALNSVASKDPKNELLLLRRGWLEYLAGNHSKSIEYYKKAANANSQSLEAQLGMMLPLMAQQRWREAMLNANKVLEAAPWNYHAHIRLMSCEQALKQWSTLEKHAQQVAARYPTDASVWVFLGRARHHLGNKDSARNAYEKVLQLVPENFEASQYVARNIP
ncbi:tetratricopeptide repeat protein [Kaarinaea lacus]